MSIRDGEREPVQVEELIDGRWVKYQLPGDGYAAGTYSLALEDAVIDGVTVNGVVSIQLLRRELIKL